MKNRELDGIYLRIKRNGEWTNVCLSDMTKKELEENLYSKRREWLIGAIVRLAFTLHDIGDQFGIERCGDG